MVTRNSRLQTTRKELGAFYTDLVVVEFLVKWGLSHSPGRVMDPSCGDGRFLKAASRLGASGLLGCDIDPDAHEEATKIEREKIIDLNLIRGDFFELEPSDELRVDLVVGNPPFIRYQKFPERSRTKALESALRLGVRLTKLTSTWAPFLLHAAQFLRPGGAMAFVVPAEIVQTNYGVPTLQALCRFFSNVRLIAFARNFFVGAQTETFLLLADGYQTGACSAARLYALSNIEELGSIESSDHTGLWTDLGLSPEGRLEFSEAFLTEDERMAWRRASSAAAVKRIADTGVVTNGYVSGANAFFHRTRMEAANSGIPDNWLIPTVRSANSIRGIEFTEKDIEDLESEGKAHHLLTPPDDDLFTTNRSRLHGLIAEGEAQKIHTRFKCRSRKPWWIVPSVHTPDLFLPYMVGRSPIASVNLAQVAYCNSIHGLKLHDPSQAHAIGTALLSSLSQLSMELEGRSYGGGILKLEPSEINRVQLSLPCACRLPIKRIDTLLRAGRFEDATLEANELVLRKSLGLDEGTIRLLGTARERLVARRYNRSRSENS